MHLKRNSRRPLTFSLSRLTSSLALLATMAAHSASAATNTLGGVSGSWNEPTNWSLGTVPSASDALLINAASPLFQGLDASFASETLSFDTGANLLSIDANLLGTTNQVLTLGGGTNALGGSDLIATSATTTGTIDLGNAPSGSFGLALGVNGSINVANAAATLNFGANSVISGNFNLSKTGNGILTLGGANTFGGAGKSFTLSAGTLNLNNAAALGNTSNTFIVNGGTIDNTSGGLTLANRAMTLGADLSFTGTNSLNLGTGAVTLTASRQINVAANLLTVGGNVGGATFGITKTGAGMLALNGVIGTTTGGLTVNDGTLVVGNANNTFTGNILVDGANSVLQLTSGSNGNATSAPLGIATGGTSYKTVTLSNGGTFRPMATYNVNTPTAALPGNGQVYIFGTGGGKLDIPTGVTMTLDDGTGTGTATTAADLQGSGNLTKTGAGFLSLGNGTSNFSTFTGQIFVNEGTLITSSGNFQLGDLAAGTTVASGAVLDVRNVLSAEPINIVGTGISSGGALITSTGTGTVPGPVTYAGNTSIGGNGTLNLTGTTNNGTFTLTKVGTGTTTFSGTTSGTGAIVVSAGNLGVSNAGTTNVIDALGSSTITQNTGTLFLKANGSANNQNITFTNAVTVAGTATVDVNRVGGTNIGSTIIASNVTLGSGAQLNVTGGNSYSLNTGALTLSGPVTLNPTTAHLNVQGKLDNAGQTINVIGTGATRFLNVAPGAGANSVTGTVNVVGGNLLGFAPAADAVTPTSNSLGTATIALSGTNPVLRLAPSFEGGLNTAPTAGLLDKSYTGASLNSLPATNLMGATQPITTGAGGQNPTGSQIVGNINIPAAVTALTSSHQYTGLINITTPGNYIFQSFTDDNGAVSIDGNAPITTSNTTASATIYLGAGLHTLTNRWNNNVGNGGDVMSYQGPDTGNAMVVVPASVLSNAAASQLTTNFGNNVTFAATSNSTIETASNTTLGALTMTGNGAGTTLNLLGTSDLTSITASSLTLTDNLTFANPTANVTITGGVNAAPGNTFALTKNGFGSLTIKGAYAPTGQISYNAGNLLSFANDGAGSNGTINQGNNLLIGTTNLAVDVRSNGGSTGNTVAFGNLLTPANATVTSTTFTGGDGYSFSFTGLALTGTSGNNTTLIANTDVKITGNVTNQMTGFATGNFDTLFLSGTSTGSSISGSIGEAGTFTPLTGGYTRIIKTGTGTWTLSGANTYTGITQVQAGTLKAGANNIFSALNLQGIDATATGAGVSAIFDLGSTTQTLNTVNGTGNALNLGGSTATSAPSIIGAGGTAILNGNVNYNAGNNPLGGVVSISTLDLNNGTRTFNVGDSTSAGIDLTVSSTITNGTLNKAGAGVLQLTNPGSAFTLALSAGTVDLAGATRSFTLAPNSAGSLTNGSLTATSILKQGPGTLNFGVQAASATSVTVNQGLVGITSNPATFSTLNVNFAATGAPTSNLINSSATLTLGGSATALVGGGALTVTGATGGTNSQSFTSTLVDAGGSAIGGTIGTGGSVAVNLGTLSRNTAGTVDFTLPAGTQSATNGIRVANPGTGGTLVTSAGTAYGTVAGNDFAAYSTDSAGNIVSAGAAGAGGISLYTTSNSGATFTGHANVTGTFTTNTGSTVESIRFNTGALTLTNTGTTTVNSGAILIGGGTSGITNITGGTIVPGAGAELVIFNNKANTLNTISSVLADNGGNPTTVTYRSNFTGTTAGILDVKANNTYTGPTFITSGRVATQSSAVTTPFGVGSNAIVHVDGTADGQFFSNQSTTIATPFVIVGNGFNENNSRLGAIRLQSQAAGQTPTLSGTITMMGDAAIGSGTYINNAYGLFSGDILTNNSAGATSFTLTKVGAGAIKLRGTNSQTATNLTTGVLNIASDNSLGVTNAPLVFNGGTAGTLQFDPALTELPASRSIVANSGSNAQFDTSLGTNGSVTTVNSIISGAGGVTKAYATTGFNTNPLILGGANTFTGNVLTTSGWLVANNNSSFGVGTKNIGAQVNTSSAAIHLDPGVGGALDFPTTFSFQTSNDTITGINEGTLTNDSGNNIIRGSVTMTAGGGGSVFASKAGTLTLAGNVTTNTAGRALKVRGDGNGVISGVISNGTTVDLPITRDLGTGTWTFSGANTYSGTTTVSSGTLKLGHVQGLGSAPVATLTTDNGTTVNGGTTGNGGTLDLGGQTNVNETIRLTGIGNGGNGVLVNTGGAVTLGTAVTTLNGTAGGLNGTAITITGGGGTGATGTAVLGVTASSFTLNATTTQYSVAPTVTISGGNGTGATATAILTGGVVTGFTITNAGTGYTAAPTLAFSGGTVSTTGTNPAATGNATNFSLLGVTLTNGGSGYTSAPTVAFSTGAGPTSLTAKIAGVTLTGNSRIGGSGDITLLNPVTESAGSFGVTKVGTNSLFLNGANTYTGATSVLSGNLIVGGSLSGSSAISVTDNGVVGGLGGLLGGTGTVGNVIAGATTPGSTVGGTINPGLLGAAGTLNIGTGTGAGLDLGLGSTLSVDLGGTGAGQYDRLNFAPNSGITLAGNLSGSLLGGFQPNNGDLFFIALNNGGVFSGAFGNTFDLGGGTPAVVLGGQLFTVSYAANFLGEGNLGNSFTGGDDIALQAVPEPGTSVALLGGLGMLLAARRRRNK